MNSARATFDYSDLITTLIIIISFASSLKKRKPFKNKSLWTILHIACFTGLFQIKKSMFGLGFFVPSFFVTYNDEVSSSVLYANVNHVAH